MQDFAININLWGIIAKANNIVKTKEDDSFKSVFNSYLGRKLVAELVIA